MIYLIPKNLGKPQVIIKCETSACDNSDDILNFSTILSLVVIFKILKGRYLISILSNSTCGDTLQKHVTICNNILLS